MFVCLVTVRTDKVIAARSQDVVIGVVIRVAGIVPTIKRCVVIPVTAVMPAGKKVVVTCAAGALVMPAGQLFVFTRVKALFAPVVPAGSNGMIPIATRKVPAVKKLMAPALADVMFTAGS